jgi:hypothetical protein
LNFTDAANSIAFTEGRRENVNRQFCASSVVGEHRLRQARQIVGEMVKLHAPIRAVGSESVPVVLENAEVAVDRGVDVERLRVVRIGELG